MSRDDSALWTGGSSASFASERNREQKAKDTDRKQQAHEARQKLLPAEELLIADYDAMIAEAKNTENVDVVGLIGIGNHALEIEMLANAKFIERLKGAKVRMTNLLRDNK